MSAAPDSLRRRQRAGAVNRTLAWVLLISLALAEVAYRVPGSEPVALGDDPVTAGRWVAFGFRVVSIGLLAAHAALSLYVFGWVRPHRTLRVFHIYLGYALLAVVLASQTTFGREPLHSRLTVLMYLTIACHIALGLAFSSRRSSVMPA
jgi:hypothetical protein